MMNRRVPHQLIAAATIGRELAGLLENFPITATAKYPPMNIYQEEDQNYVVVMAVAGFKKEDLDIRLHPKDRFLQIEGKRDKDQDKGEDRKYLVNNIAMRSFSTQIPVPEFSVIKSASLNDGLLTIQFSVEPPEEMKTKKVDIT